MIDFNINNTPPLEIALDMQMTISKNVLQQSQSQNGQPNEQVLQGVNIDEAWSGTND